MQVRNFNWQIWIGLFVSLGAAFTYPAFFVNFPVTRNFPWANLLMFAVAATLVVLGLRRAFRTGRSRLSKISGSVLAGLSILIFGLFLFSFFVLARQLPASHNAPQVGQRAPDFTLADSSGKTVSLSQLLSSPINEKTSKGVFLIFYRGYW